MATTKRKSTKAEVETPVEVVEPEVVATEDPFTNGVVVNCEALRLREEPNLEGKILCTIPKGETIRKCKSEDSSWLKAEFNGFNGFVMSEYVK